MGSISSLVSLLVGAVKRLVALEPQVASVVSTVLAHKDQLIQVEQTLEGVVSELRTVLAEPAAPTPTPSTPAQ